MVWNIKNNSEKIKEICVQYDIDYSLNRDVIDHISLQELLAKIAFLSTHNMPIVLEDKKLSDIFLMSSVNVKEKYGLSLEDLIDEYYIKREDGKEL